MIACRKARTLVITCPPGHVTLLAIILKGKSYISLKDCVTNLSQVAFPRLCDVASQKPLLVLEIFIFYFILFYFLDFCIFIYFYFYFHFHFIFYFYLFLLFFFFFFSFSFYLVYCPSSIVCRLGFSTCLYESVY